VRGALNLRQARRRNVLPHDHQGYDVQGYEGRGALRGEGRKGGKLYQLL
jgi:hypothetical protein